MSLRDAPGRWALVVIAATVSLPATMAGCTGDDMASVATTTSTPSSTTETTQPTTTTTEATTTTTTEVAPIDEVFSIDTPDGEAVIDPDGTPIPQFYTAGFPRLDLADFWGSATIDGKSQSEGWNIGVLITAASPQEAFDFYVNAEGFSDPTSGTMVASPESTGTGQEFVGRMVLANNGTRGGADVGSITTFSRGGQNFVVIVLGYESNL